MNWYVLFVLSNRSNQLIKNLNKKDSIEAFIPQYQYYRRVTKDYDVKPMFTNYIFVKTLMNQTEFNTFLMNLDNEKDGLIKQLVYLDTSALKKEHSLPLPQERRMFKIMAGGGKPFSPA